VTTDTKYQPCEVDQATHCRLASGGLRQIGVCGAGDIHKGERYISVPGGDFCHERSWQALGIIPLKKVEVKPLEFETCFGYANGQWHEAKTLDDGLGYSIVKKFKCVEVVE